MYSLFFNLVFQEQGNLIQSIDCPHRVFFKHTSIIAGFLEGIVEFPLAFTLNDKIQPRPNETDEADTEQYDQGIDAVHFPHSMKYSQSHPRPPESFQESKTSVPSLL